MKINFIAVLWRFEKVKLLNTNATRIQPIFAGIIWNGSNWIEMSSKKIHPDINWCPGSPQSKNKFYILIIFIYHFKCCLNHFKGFDTIVFLNNGKSVWSLQSNSTSHFKNFCVKDI